MNNKYSCFFQGLVQLFELVWVFEWMEILLVRPVLVVYGCWESSRHHNLRTKSKYMANRSKLRSTIINLTIHKWHKETCNSVVFYTACCVSVSICVFWYVVSLLLNFVGFFFCAQFLHFYKCCLYVVQLQMCSSFAWISKIGVGFFFKQTLLNNCVVLEAGWLYKVTSFRLPLQSSTKKSTGQKH